MKQPVVHIILLNWNGYKDTIECVKNLKKIEYPNYQIVLVDNGSRDDSVLQLKSEFPEIPLIEIKNNIGFSAGANVGIRYALNNNADYVLLMNNDAVVKADFLSELIKTAESSPEIGIVSPIIYYFNRKDIIQSAGGQKNYHGSYPFVDKYYQHADSGEFKENISVDTVIGCSMLIKREVINKIGLLDEKHFIYAEDTDFCIRAKNHGFLVYTVVTAKVWHKVSASSGGNEHNLTYLYYNTRNMIYFSKKNLKPKERIIYNYYFFLGRIHELLRFFLAKDYKAVRAMTLGLLHGYIGKTGYNK